MYIFVMQEIQVILYITVLLNSMQYQLSDLPPVFCTCHVDSHV